GKALRGGSLARGCAPVALGFKIEGPGNLSHLDDDLLPQIPVSPTLLGAFSDTGCKETNAKRADESGNDWADGGKHCTLPKRIVHLVSSATVSTASVVPAMVWVSPTQFSLQFSVPGSLRALCPHPGLAKANALTAEIEYIESASPREGGHQADMA